MAVLALIVLALLLRSCTTHEKPESPSIVIRERIDTVRVAVPTIKLQSAPAKTVVRYDTVVDRKAVDSLLQCLDAANTALANAGVRRTFSLDTITSRGDTVYVECVETNKTISLTVRPAPVEKHVKRVDTLRIEPTRKGLQPYVSAAASYAMSQQWAAQANAGIRLLSGGDALPFADIQYHTIHGALVRIGVEITF